MNTSLRIVAAVCGLVVMGGSAWAWHEWQVDGFLAAIIAVFVGGGLFDVAFRNQGG